MRLAGKELLGVPDEAAQVDGERAILFRIPQDLIAQNTDILLNLLVLILQDLARVHRSPNCLQCVRIQEIWLEARIVKVICKHGLQR